MGREARIGRYNGLDSLAFIYRRRDKSKFSEHTTLLNVWTASTSAGKFRGTTLFRTAA